MNSQIDSKLVKQDFFKMVLKAYPFFMVFYLVSFQSSFFSSNWQTIFYWPAFHTIALLFSIIFFWNYSFLNFIKKIKWTKALIFKVFFIVVVLLFSLNKDISVVNFLILEYALVSVLFMLESRISGMFALLFLTSCPILLILKKDVLAETMAIYAYYFLVTTVLTQMREIRFENTIGNKS